MSSIAQINNKHRQLLEVGTSPEALGIYPGIGNEKPNGGELFKNGIRIGAFQEYDGGLIYWSVNARNNFEAFEVHGKIREKYASLGWETSFLLFPTTDQTPTRSSRGFQNEFEGGIIMHKSGSADAFEVHGQIYNLYKQYGYDTGSLGFPISDEMSISGSDCKYSNFEGGTIYWTPATGAHVITAPFVIITNITRTPIHARFFRPDETNINGPTFADGFRNIAAHTSEFWKLPAGYLSTKVAFDGEQGGINFGSTVKLVKAGNNLVYNTNQAVTIRNATDISVVVRIYNNAELVHLAGVTLENGTSPQGDVSTGAFNIGPNLELDYLMPDDVQAIKIRFGNADMRYSIFRGQRVVLNDTNNSGVARNFVGIRNTHPTRTIRFLFFNADDTSLAICLNDGDISVKPGETKFYNSKSDCLTAPRVSIRYDVDTPNWIGYDGREKAKGIPAVFGEFLNYDGVTMRKTNS
ncbi:MAG: hypothetical protein IPP60_01195 [Sphingobacteriales bacterium]|nr:hypothetical protein [Sphingobacteriales bacterium]